MYKNFVQLIIDKNTMPRDVIRNMIQKNIKIYRKWEKRAVETKNQNTFK